MIDLSPLFYFFFVFFSFLFVFVLLLLSAFFSNQKWKIQVQPDQFHSCKITVCTNTPLLPLTIALRSLALSLSLSLVLFLSLSLPLSLVLFRSFSLIPYQRVCVFWIWNISETTDNKTKKPFQHVSILNTLHMNQNDSNNFIFRSNIWTKIITTINRKAFAHIIYRMGFWRKNGL